MMSGHTGFWIAITVLALATVVMFSLFFIQQTEINIARRALSQKTPEQLQEMGNQHVRNLIEEIAAYEAVNEGIMPEVDNRVFSRDLQTNEMVEEIRRSIDDLESRLARDIPTTTKRVTGVIPILEQRIKKMSKELQALEIEFQSTLISVNLYENMAKRAEGDVAGIINVRSQVQRLLDEAQRDRDVDLQRMNTRLEQEAQLYRGENTMLQSDINSTRITNNELVETSIRMHRELVTEKQGLHQALTAKVQVTGPRTLISREEYDGEVVNVDTITKTMVVNLGRINRVRRGMRFDVIRWEDNAWQFIASVELVRVHETTSTAVVMDRVPIRVFDPTTGYEAPLPEEIYSPFVATGDDGNRAVRLLREEAEYVSTMMELKPILRGDKISNPFYSVNKVLRFTVTGEPVRYSKDRVHRVLRQNGALVQDRVDATTDFLIVGMIPDRTQARSDEELKQIEAYEEQLRIAETYGVPVLREVNLFDFLRLDG